MTVADVPAVDLAARRSSGAPIEVRPDGVVALRRAGRSPYRVLMFGGGALMGWGILDHDRGLPGEVATRLQSKTSRGVDLDVIVDADPTGAAGVALIRGLRIARYDAVVVVLGERAALEGTSRASWSSEFETLLRTVNAEASKATPVLVFDSAKPMVAVSASGLRARRAIGRADKLAAVSADVCAGGRVAFAELDPPGSVLGWGRQFAAANHRGWADEIVAALRRGLETAGRETGPDTAVAVRDREQDERFRQRSVESMGLTAGTRDALLDGIALQAKAVYRAAGASLNIVDNDRVWSRASSQSVLPEIPRALSFEDLAVRTDRPLLVNDATTDPRFGEAPEVAGLPVHFYAGEPIHSVDGYRIGVLCVVDSRPRALRQDHLAELHVLAGRIERELWARVLGARR